MGRQRLTAHEISSPSVTIGIDHLDHGVAARIDLIKIAVVIDVTIVGAELVIGDDGLGNVADGGVRIVRTVDVADSPRRRSSDAMSGYANAVVPLRADEGFRAVSQQRGSRSSEGRTRECEKDIPHVTLHLEAPRRSIEQRLAQEGVSTFIPLLEQKQGLTAVRS